MARPRPFRSALLSAALLLAAVPAAPAPLSAQSAQEIMADFRAAWQARVEGVERYTVVQRVMGQEQTTRFVREEVEGVPVFRPEPGEGMPEAGGARMDQAFFLRSDIARRMTAEGTAEVDGRTCRVVRLTDFQGLEELGDGGLELRSLSFCIDPDAQVIRRMRMEGTAPAGAADGGPRDVAVTSVMRDYREVEGMLHPWRVEMTVQGVGMGPDERARMEEAMAEMEAQLERIPEAQREQMRRMMESRMEGMQGMAGVAAGEPVVIETVEVRVNGG